MGEVAVTRKSVPLPTLTLVGRNLPSETQSFEAADVTPIRVAAKTPE